MDSMSKIQIRSSPEVKKLMDGYPKEVRSRLLHIRKLIIESAEEMEDVNFLQESLKWGEASYRSDIGSTLRMDWKSKAPDQYAIYFQCTSRLIPTFKFSFNNIFKFEGNRAIIFSMSDNIPENELIQCIKATLRYHKVKHLPTLGI